MLYTLKTSRFWCFVCYLPGRPALIWANVKKRSLLLHLEESQEFGVPTYFGASPLFPISNAAILKYWTLSERKRVSNDRSRMTDETCRVVLCWGRKTRGRYAVWNGLFCNIGVRLWSTIKGLARADIDNDAQKACGKLSRNRQIVLPRIEDCHLC